VLRRKIQIYIYAPVPFLVLGFLFSSFFFLNYMVFLYYLGLFAIYYRRVKKPTEEENLHKNLYNWALFRLISVTPMLLTFYIRNFFKNDALFLVLIIITVPLTYFLMIRADRHRVFEDEDFF